MPIPTHAEIAELEQLVDETAEAVEQAAAAKRQVGAKLKEARGTKTHSWATTQYRNSHAGLMRAIKTHQRASRKLEAAKQAIPVGGISTTREAPVYVEGGRFSFWSDLTNRQHDAGAAERLDRNERQMADALQLRDSDTSSATGFIPPAYLGGEFSIGVRPSAVVRNSCTRVEMPSAGIGEAIIPEITTGISVNGQAAIDSDNIAATGDPGSSQATSGMATFAATIVVNRQEFERGFQAGLSADAVAELDRAIDKAMISGVAGTGNGAGFNGLLTAAAGSSTYTDASPTAGKLLDALYVAQTAFAEQRDAAAEFALMHPRTAYMLAGGRDTSLPIFQQGSLAPGSADATWSVGTLAGLRVLVSQSVPTNFGNGSESPITLYRGSDVFYAMTEARYQFMATASSKDQVIFQAVSYVYFWANRHSGNDVLVLSGTGLV